MDSINPNDPSIILRHFLDDKGRLKQFPAKRGMKLVACEYLKTKLEPNRIYTEPELNDILDAYTAFHDPATLRREMYDAHCIDRDRNGARYWVENGDGTETGTETSRGAAPAPRKG